MTGSIDGKSLGDSSSIRFARQFRTNSRPERDLSPSSVYSLNDQVVRSSQRLNASGQHPGASLSSSANILGEATEITNENARAADNKDPFCVRTLMDNLRQILNEDDVEQPSTTTPVNKALKK